MSFLKTVKTDAYRIVISKRTYVCLIIMTALTFISFLDGEDFDLPASAFYFAMYGSDSHTFLLNLIISFLIYGGCFIEDFNAMSVRNQLLRTKLINYVMSKMILAHICSVISFMISFISACAVLSIFKDWFKSESMNFVANTEFGFFYTNKSYILYMLIVAFEWGLLSGMLTSFCQLVSLYINDTVLCASLTFVTAFILNYVSVLLDSNYTFLTIFHAMSHKQNAHYKWFIQSIAVSLSVLVIITFFARIKIVRRIRSE